MTPTKSHARRHVMDDRLHTAARRAVGAVKIAVLGVLTALALTVTGSATTPSAPSAGPSTSTSPDGLETPAPDGSAGSADVAALIERHHCSTSGLDDDVIPGSAIVRRGEQVSLVSFERGWATFTGEAEGTLVAVCP